MEPHAFTSDDFTLRNVRRDFPEWHRGRRRYALWALEVDFPSVMQRVRAAQAHLAGLLLDGYCRQPHVTVRLCGFPSDSPRHADDFGPESLRIQLAALRQARPRPFEIDIGGLSSFTSAPYLTVSDGGGNLAALREALFSGFDGDPGGHYTPHVTVGLYADAWPLPMVQACMSRFEIDAPLRLRVSGISLLSYAAPEIGGALTPIGHYDFASASLRWSGSPPFSLSSPA